MDTQPIIINVKAGNKFFDQTRMGMPVYSTHSKNRGIVLIINVINYEYNVLTRRLGAEVDGKHLQELFTQMGLTVYMHVDLTSKEIKQTIGNFKSSPEISKVDMLFVIIMAHGERGEYVYGSDNVTVNSKWIEQQFDNENCKPLQTKPKIIMFQFCRGTTADYGVEYTEIVGNIMLDGPRDILRTREDMLVAHSTLPGNVSHRDTYHGTWYIQTFCKIMMDHACDHHIEDIFKLVDMKMTELISLERTLQTSTFTNIGFNKHCYMHPKIYLNNGVIKYISDDSIAT